jgi:lysophospholipase L1-like esterase
MRIALHSKLIMIGDSITDCGRDRESAEATGDGLGNGYVSLVNALLHSAAPQARVRVVNQGVSGNTVRDLRARWQADVLDHRPDWLSVMIGINDVWRHFNPAVLEDELISEPEFESTLDELLAKAKPHLQGLVLLTPFFIEPNRAEPMRAMMDVYGAAVKRLAAKHQAILVDTQAVWDAALVHLHPMGLAMDRVHPNLTGHALLARAFLQAIE